MGGGDAGGTKAIANRIKAKGLSKLRWYCQMCQKQCRDDNGFKCHLMAESHQRQMKIFNERPSGFMDQFSKDFEAGFTALLARKYRKKRIAASQLYNEYISDRDHTHMNGTIWTSLGSFVQYLGKTGKAQIDQTEKGWFITYIAMTPEEQAREEQFKEKERQDLNDEEREAKHLAKQIKMAQKVASDDAAGQGAPADNDLAREADDEKIQFSFGGAAQPGPSLSLAEAPSVKASAFTLSMNASRVAGLAAGSAAGSASTGKRKLSALEQIKQQNEKKKAKEEEQKKQEAEFDAGPAAGASSSSQYRHEYWLAEGIVVKIMNKRLKDGRYYKRKAEVRKVHSKYVGEVELVETGECIKIDQDELETVVPSEGAPVLILNGYPQNGQRAVLDVVHRDDFCATLTVASGESDAGVVLHNVQYEDFSKAI